MRIQTAGRRLVREGERVSGIETASLDGAPWGLVLLSELAEALGSCMKPPQTKPCDRFAQWTIRGVEDSFGTRR